MEDESPTLSLIDMTAGLKGSTFGQLSTADL